MAAAVARVFEEGGVLLAEAGTGTGKTLAYLVPAILSRQRVLISTGTKNLQEQIFFKDIPALREALGVPFTATYMKGRANYLCLHRLDQLTDGVRTAPAAHDVFLPIIREWSARTETGDRAELEDLPEDLPFWNEVSATAETCLGTECPRYDDCFVTRMRQRAAASDVVIVNHHLLCADAAVRQSAYGEVIPACTRAILDEAHQLEDVATQYFGFSVSTYRVEELARDVERLGGRSDRQGERRDREGRSTGSAITRAPSSASSPSRIAARGASGARSACARPSSRSGRPHDAAAHLTGALDLVEANLALLRPVRRDGDEDARRRRRGDDDATDAGDARAPRRAAARRAAVPAARRRRGVRLLRRVPRHGHLPARLADRRLRDRARAAARPHADDRPHVGDADRRRHVRLRARPARHRERQRDPAAVGVRLPPAGDSLSAAPHARSARRRTSPWPPAARWSRS